VARVAADRAAEVDAAEPPGPLSWWSSSTLEPPGSRRSSRLDPRGVARSRDAASGRRARIRRTATLCSYSSPHRAFNDYLPGLHDDGSASSRQQWTPRGGACARTRSTLSHEGCFREGLLRHPVDAHASASCLSSPTTAAAAAAARSACRSIPTWSSIGRLLSQMFLFCAYLIDWVG
jgi:hypothetical protein